MAMVSPLHRAIDAGRWDAERLLGRLVILVHAAFLDAGFVPLPRRSRKPGPVPRQAGRTASALSLRYGVPQLLLHRQDADEVAVLRILAHGRRHLILYVKCGPWPVERCVLVDALAAAPLVAGGLDRTARALRSDARTAGLWRRLSDDLCRRALVDMCGRNGVALEPSFMSLPGDAKAAIMARLTNGADLARLELVCAGLRRLVAERDRQLWKPRYDALARRAAPWLHPGCCCLSPETSWKERYVMARRWQPPPAFLPGDNEVTGPYRRVGIYYVLAPFISPFRPRRPVDADDEPELAADAVADRNNRIAAARGKRAGGRGRSPPPCVHESRRRGAGAVHAPSSRYRWRHR